MTRTLLINLDLERPSLQPTDIVLNQANKDSVTFNIKIYKDAVEIEYTAFDRAEMVFIKPDKNNVVEDAEITADGLIYTLTPELFGVNGRAVGYVSLYQDATITATLHYSFMIISDLINAGSISNTYVPAIERLTADVEAIRLEAEGILLGLQNGCFDELTPIICFSISNTGSLTYSSRTGYSYRIGKLCFLYIDIGIETISSKSGYVMIAGLKYAPANRQHSIEVIGCGGINLTVDGSLDPNAVYKVGCAIDNADPMYSPAQILLFLYQSNSTGTPKQLGRTNVVPGFFLRIAGFYQIADSYLVV